MKSILVNATAIINGGGLTILKQFIDNISDTNCKYYIFSSLLSLQDEYKNKKNIIFIFPNAKGLLNRLIWDNYGVKQWIKRNNIDVDLFISLQNTGVNIDNNIPQIVYIHQSIPFTDKSWNIFKQDERSLWFYKNIYGFFIGQHLKSTDKVIVQAEWLKDKFSKKHNYSIDNIYVCKPNFNKFNQDSLNYNKNLIDKNFYNIFYPAFPYLYKNHIEIIKALEHLKFQKKDISNIKVFFTFVKEDNLDIYSKILEYNLKDNFVFLGNLNFLEMNYMYKNVDLVTFPSYIETFGLPLIEASSFGIPILCANKEYSREVIGKYDGVKFIKINNAKLWANNIFLEYKEKNKYKEFEYNNTNSWNYLFEIINKTIKEKEDVQK
jgi:glycosyltransferase involved in cell wall biosynthesis